ncbi:S1 RNA-binding domain-containing protein [Streptomyces hydrogenans]|uniref:S1 RNA-binding domain-containing protein n=1 Tax=Streptomyces hydrogenans TaxID=1873719 RepID=UPI0037F939EB
MVGPRCRVSGWRDGWAVRKPGTVGVLGVPALRRHPVRHRRGGRAVRGLRGTRRGARPLFPGVGFIVVDLGDGIAGLLPFREFPGHPAVGPVEEFEAGETITVVVTDIDPPTRRVRLSSPQRGRHEGAAPAS